MYRLGRFAEAIDAAMVLQRRFPTSRYLPNTRLLIGDSFFNSKHYSEAASQYGRLLATQAPLGIQAQAAERLAAMYWKRTTKSTRADASASGRRGWASARSSVLRPGALVSAPRLARGSRPGDADLSRQRRQWHIRSYSRCLGERPDRI